MRRSLKWVLTLLPVTAASVGTAIYLTSENSISSLNEVNLNRKNVQIETRIAPLASSQEAKENIKAELVSPEKPVEEVLDPKKLIIPEKIDAPTKTETVKSEEKQKTPEKDVRKPILIGETRKTKPISKKPDKKTTTIAKPDVVVVLPQTKTTEPKKEENQKIVENKNKEKVIIANSKKEDVVIPRKTDLPIEKILVFPETKVEEPKIVQKPIESPIVGTIENKSSDQKAKIAVKSAIISKPSQDEKEKEIKKQQELEIKIKAEKLRIEKEKEKLEAKRKEEEEIKKQKEAELKKQQEIEEQERKIEEERKQKALELEKKQKEAKQITIKPENTLTQSSGQNSGTLSGDGNSGVQGVKTDSEIADELVKNISQDLTKVSFAYQLESKYSFANSAQFDKFIEKIKVPTNLQQRDNLVSFLTNAYGKLNEQYAFHPGIRDEWRKEIYRRLKISPPSFEGDLNRIFSGGGRFGGGFGFP